MGSRVFLPTEIRSVEGLVAEVGKSGVLECLVEEPDVELDVVVEYGQVARFGGVARV